jgi:hypothetical protein
VLQLSSIKKINIMSIQTKSVLETVKKVATKKASKKVKVARSRKPLTQKQKDARALKRVLEPTFSNAVSKAVKVDTLEMKQDFRRSLLDAKKKANLLNDVNLDGIQNLLFINDCKAYINKLFRKGNEKQIEAFKKSNKLNKWGKYQTNWILSNISKEVKKMA